MILAVVTGEAPRATLEELDNDLLDRVPAAVNYAAMTLVSSHATEEKFAQLESAWRLGGLGAMGALVRAWWGDDAYDAGHWKGNADEPG